MEAQIGAASMRALLVLCALATSGQTAAAQAASPPLRRLTPAPVAQTDEVPHSGDAADDPSIWVHPSEPGRSLIIATDKQGGLNAYNLEGKLVQTISPDYHPNNVDLIYDFQLAGQRVDLAVASTRGEDLSGVKVWKIDRASGRLAELAPGVTFSCFPNDTPYGLCCYQSRRTGRSHVVVNSKRGEIEQYLLCGGQCGENVSARCVRRWKVSSQTEGCVADRERGLLYVGEEEVGIWRFGAEPDSAEPPRLIARVGEHGLASNVEGLTIYYAARGRGYLIASSQGSSTFHVYDRAGDNRLVAIVDPVATAAIDDVSDTDGIDVASCSLGDRFPSGLFIVQDGETASGRQNFKLFDWRDVAGNKLLVDTNWHPRANTKSTEGGRGRWRRTALSR